VILAGQVGVAGHLTIGDDVTVLGKSGITKSLRKPGMYAGMPVRPVESWRRAMVWLYRTAAKDAGETDSED
jgi:UDP-3-O-[3-hydroxymyristoyl] glucosamine N-acyltransferase